MPSDPAVPAEARAAEMPAGGDRRQYQAMLGRIREIVSRVVPVNATILTISRGDARLLDLEGRRAVHFPQHEHGQYAGFHPADSTAAITHLESLRARGADFLLIPATAFWWLDHYRHFRRHLERRYAVATRDQETCVIFALREEAEAAGPAAASAEERRYRALIAQVREVVEALLPPGAAVAVLSGGDEALLAQGDRRVWHFPMDERGGFAGFYPADSAGAIEHLERVRARGAEYLVLPATAAWWLTFYREFAAHLADTCRLVTDQSNVCIIYALTPASIR